MTLQILYPLAVGATETERDGAMAKGKEKTGYNTRIDESWNWIEGLKPNSSGRNVWYPLYCYRKDDVLGTTGIFNHIQRKIGEGGKLLDELDTFSDFRIRWAGEETDSIPTTVEIRNPAGGFALAKILRDMAPRCGKVNPKTGAICVRAPGHFPKTRHSSDPDE
jgi:hypothetical protein